MSTQPLEDTSRRIQQAALELFTSHGYDKTSLREIADRLGFTKAALYYHFPSKEQLLDSLVTPMLTEYESVLDACATQRPGPSRRRHLVEAYLEVMLRHRTLLRLFINDSTALAASGSGQRGRALGERALALLVDGEEGTAAGVRAAAALGALHFSVISFLDTPADELRGPVLDSVFAVLGVRNTVRRETA